MNRPKDIQTNGQRHKNYIPLNILRMPGYKISVNGEVQKREITKLSPQSHIIYNCVFIIQSTY